MRTLILLLLILASILEAQLRKNSVLSENVTLSLEGGMTIAKTDYKTSLPGIGNRGMFEYFFGNYNKHTFGVRVFAGGQSLRGEDSRKEYGTFNTGSYYAGVGFTYVFELNNRILPYASANLSHLWVSTEQKNIILERILTQENTVYSFSFEAGSRFRILENLYFNFNAALDFLNDDLLDNTELGINNDFYIRTMAGLSFAFTAKKDSDDDGIANNEDKCPNAAEDFDGYEDNDGCPDPDNDKDGIPDAIDACPELAEDFDGWEDNDGCPDIDNDKDGIPDTVDKCPNIEEDFDGYEDEDGCADLDNDSDGILDENDRCPDIAEDFDGFQDNDGCPDLDNDGDGIYDEKDKCPDQAETFNNFQDNDGCPDVVPQRIEPDQYIEPERPQQRNTDDQALRRTEIKREETKPEVESDVSESGSASSFLLHGVTTFESESSQLNPQAYAELDKIAASIKRNSKSIWRIEGYTDNSMPEKENVDISRKRAQSVFKYLVSKGVSQSQLEVVGMGSRNPVDSNEKAFGRMRNRRVEIKQVR